MFLEPHNLGSGEIDTTALIGSCFDSPFVEICSYLFCLCPYFQDVIGEWSEHRTEHIRELNGNCHSNLYKPVFWEDVERDVVAHANRTLVMWDLAQKELSELAILRARYGSLIKPGGLLPNDYARALYRFDFFVKDMRPKGIEWV